jgi:hypothetical protein
VKWVDMKVQEGNSVQRWTRPERNGLGLMTGLIAGFRKRGGEIVPRRRSRGSASRAAASPACKAATPGPARAWPSKASP